MHWIFNDLRAWATAGFLALVLGSAAVLDRLMAPSLPLEDQFRASSAQPLEGLPRRLQALVGDVGQARLEASSTFERVPNPYAGAPLVEVRPGVSLPAGLLEDLARALGREDAENAVDHVLDSAWAAVSDPDGRIAALPGLEERLRADIEASFWAELATWGEILRAAPAFGPRPWAPVAGLAQASVGGSVGAELEGAVYETWVDVLAREAADVGRPSRTFRLGLPVGTWKTASPTTRAAFGLERTWHPDYVDMEGLVEEWETALAEGTEPPTADPFGPLGQLRALQLLAEADRVTLIFGGHGQEVADPARSPVRFAAYALDGLGVGDECQELGLLRSHRGGLTARYGFCLDGGDTLVALSCSNAWADRSGPQHNTASLAWLITHGSPAPFGVIEPVGFRIFTPLQEGFRAAATEADVDDAVRTALFSAGEQLPERDPRFTEALDLGEEVWLLKTRDATVTDLVVVGPGLGALPERQDRRLTLASTAWTRVVPTAQIKGPAQAREAMRLCGGRVDCDRRLDHLHRNLAGTWPTEPKDAVPIGLAGRQHQVLADPNRTHPWVRLYVVPAAGESEEAWLRRADAAVRSISGRRVVSVGGWSG